MLRDASRTLLKQSVGSISTTRMTRTCRTGVCHSMGENPSQRNKFAPSANEGLSKQHVAPMKRTLESRKRLVTDTKLECWSQALRLCGEERRLKDRLVSW